jgi:nuclear transport factor 2 (NTF2) superfamily protein
MTESASPKLVPPFNEETAAMKVKAAEALWNTCDPERVALAYTEDAEWRNRDEFLSGRAEIVAFLKRKWARELEYSLRKTLWSFNENRISVSFEYESRDAQGQWYRSYGVELWEFALDGRMRRRIASINDVKIQGPSS